MALTSDSKPLRRNGADFGYPVAAGEKVFRGGFVCVNSAGAMVRPQTSGAVAFVGVADRGLDNSSGGSVSDTSVVAVRGVFAAPVASAGPTNINASVYLVDDNTLTLTQVTSGTALLSAGTVVGIEGGRVYVRTPGVGA